MSVSWSQHSSHSACFLAVAVAAVTLVAAGGCKDDRTPSEPASAPSHSSPAATTSASAPIAKRTAGAATSAATSAAADLCKRIDDDNQLAWADALSGDVLVLGYQGLRDPKKLASRALKAGARLAEPHIVQPGYVKGKRGILPLAAAGVSSSAMAELRRFVASGRLPADGAVAEIALHRGQAALLGVDVGEQLFMVLSDAKTEQPTARKTALQVVGLLDTSDAWAVSAQTAVLSLAQLRALLPGKAADGVTSLAVYLKEGADRDAWAKAFAEKLDDPGHQVLSAVELQREPILLRDSARSVCEGAPSKNAAARPVSPPKLLDCTEAETSASELSYLRTIVGDVILDVAPQHVPASFAIAGGKQLATTPAPLQWVVGWLLTAERARYAQLLGLPGDRLDVLRARVSSGSLDELSAKGGVALPSGLAAELGVRTGDTLALGQLTPPNRQGPQLPAGLRQLKVAAIVSFPLEAVSPLSTVVFAHTDYLRSMTPATAMVSAVRVAEPRPTGWLDDLRIASHGRPLLVVETGDTELSRQREVLKTTCK